VQQLLEAGDGDEVLAAPRRDSLEPGALTGVVEVADGLFDPPPVRVEHGTHQPMTAPCLRRSRGGRKLQLCHFRRHT
jgi:hypothetical protein